MNLYLRLVGLLFRLPFIARRDLFASARVGFRVWPNDCDINLHMNNGRYLTFMDLARVYLLAQIGLLGTLFRKRWAPIVSAAEMNFIRPLKPFQRFDVVPRVLTWDDKYFYIEHRFESDGKLMAVGMIKGLLLSGGRPVPMQAVLEAMKLPHAPPALPDVVRHWNEMSDLKKQYTVPNP